MVVYTLMYTALERNCKVAIIGGGILGTSVAYFLSSIFGSQVLVIEQERNVALHTSSRNTGKVHAPFLYDPTKKKLFARAAYLGYDMWRKYSDIKQVRFVQDGVLEVAVDQRGIDMLQKYKKWAVENGIQPEEEIKILEKRAVKNMEPSVDCHAGLYCSRDASTDYGTLTRSLFLDAQSFGCRFLLGHKLTGLMHSNTKGLMMVLSGSQDQKKISTEFLINTAGGNALDIAHSMNLAQEYTDFHFRGEYWQAPSGYRDLTKISVYSVPMMPDYPFLDPHWIIRTDGRREIGPSAFPVFGPYAYDWKANLKYFLPKTYESLRAAGARKIFFDRQFLSLVSREFKSSVSKSSMINRVKKFLPQLKASSFSTKGTSGIRSLLVNKDGRFVPDTLVIKHPYSMHVLNYNSPGATGALPIAAMIANQLFEDGLFGSVSDRSKSKSMFDFRAIADKMKG